MALYYAPSALKFFNVYWHAVSYFARQLGIAVSRVKFGARAVAPEILVGFGWHSMSPGESAVWTMGDARINIPRDVRFLGLNIRGFPLQWLAP